MGRPREVLARSNCRPRRWRWSTRTGSPGLSMRALAAALGTGPMTLYNHVADRADLEVLVVEAVVARGDVAARAEHADWRDDVRAIATAHVARGARAPARDPADPHAAQPLAGGRSRSPRRCSQALARSGRSGADLLDRLPRRVGVRHGLRAGRAGRTAVASRRASAPHAVIRRFRALPRERYPHLIEIATAAVDQRRRARVPRRPRPPARRPGPSPP